jgi:diguanylate cyclase (GGDEF)-like protein
MTLLVLCSLSLLAIAVGWSFVLLQRLRDWRLGFVIASLIAALGWLVALTVRLVLVDQQGAAGSLQLVTGPGPLQQLAVSGLAMAGVIYCHVLFQRDDVTGLPNRARFLNRLRRSLGRFHRDGDAKFAVLLLDLDRFTVINHSLGQHSGDQLLLAVAGRLRACIRPGDVIARLKSDEFALLLHGSDEVSALCTAELVKEQLSQPIKVDDQEVLATACIGISIGSPAHERAERLLREADLATYRAKSRGNGQHEVFRASMHEHAVKRLALEADLRRAVERAELRLHYQPIVAARDGRIAGLEALVRWHHADHGMILPDEFISMAEETGLIVPIGLWVLEEACRQMRAWQAQFPAARHCLIHVNLSGRQFAQADLVQDVRRILRRTGLPPKSLGLEITESVVMDDVERAIKMLSQLHALDVELQIDDFGTGYSSLSYLNRLPVDTLKVDRSFVIGMEADSENAKIVRSVVTLAHDLNMDVIAEGVETVDQLRLLRSMGCGLVQGNLMSKAIDESSLQPILVSGQLPNWPFPRRVAQAI